MKRKAGTLTQRLPPEQLSLTPACKLEPLKMIPTESSASSHLSVRAVTRAEGSH